MRPASVVKGIDMVKFMSRSAGAEGFLRSDRSLIQTIGRAARHLEGRAIFYADRITGSMQRAIEETGRRREIQRAYNEQHGIRPASVVKGIDQVKFITRIADARAERESRVAEEKASYGAGLEAKELTELLERQMREAATALDFETAARLRDQLFELKARNGGSVARPAIADLRARR